MPSSIVYITSSTLSPYGVRFRVEFSVPVGRTTKLGEGRFAQPVMIRLESADFHPQTSTSKLPPTNLNLHTFTNSL